MTALAKGNEFEGNLARRLIEVKQLDYDLTPACGLGWWDTT